MGNILNYLREKGDIPLNKLNFNEVDNVVLSQLAYLDFDGIVPGIDSRRHITVEEACKAFFAKYSVEELSKLKYMNSDTPLLLKLMAEGRRFKRAKLSKYVSQFDSVKGKQFAALHIGLSNRTTYVAFRGTDDNIISWQEDFSMSYETVPAQVEAVRYLCRTLSNRNKQFRLGGHSKGGNLAVYAATKCPEQIKTRIIEVYDNDGPGFDEEFLGCQDYLTIRDKIIHITPEFSVVGMLFEHEGRHKIVSSSQKGITQHDGMTWEVNGCEFVNKDNLTKRSKLLSQTLSRWIGSLKVEQRKEFVKSFFGILRQNGIEKMSEISEGKRRQFFKICDMVLHMSKPTKAALMTLVFSFITIYGKEGWSMINSFWVRR